MNRYFPIITLMSVLLNPLLAQQNESISIRQLQYWPEDEAIVCVDGTNRFTRSLYGKGQDARLMTSDDLEFGLWVSGIASNLRFDIDHIQIHASYDGASREYRVALPVSMRRDSRQEAQVLISAYALHLPTAGAIWQIEGRNVKAGVKMQMRFGALNGDQQDFAFTPDHCVGNSFKLDAHNSHFEASSAQGSLRGQVSPSIQMQLADAKSKEGKSVVYLTASIPLDKPSIVAISQSEEHENYNLQTMLFESKSRAYSLISDYEVNTPDALINALEFVLPATEYAASLNPTPSISALEKLETLVHQLEWRGNADDAKRYWPSIDKTLAQLTQRLDADGDGLFCMDGSIMYEDAAATSVSARMCQLYRQAAGIAHLVGEGMKAEQYDAAAAKAQQVIGQQLWIEDLGVWAECRDVQGLKRQHRHPRLATIIASVNGEIGTPQQRLRATQYVDAYMPRQEFNVMVNGRCPLSFGNRGSHIASSDWMPADVLSEEDRLSEEMQMALAYWKVGRPDQAYELFRTAVTDYMYLDNAPGNLPNTASSTGVVSRALIEGLIGVQPDLLSGVLTIRPGLPSAWDGREVSFSTPDFEFRRSYRQDSAVWYFMGHGAFFERYDSIVIQAPAKSAFAGELADSEGVRWEKTSPLNVQPLSLIPQPSSLGSQPDCTDPASIDWSTLIAVSVAKKHNLKVADIFKQRYSYKADKKGRLDASSGVQVSDFQISDAQGLKAAFTSRWKNFPDKLLIKLPKKPARRLYLKMVGTTNALQSHIENGVIRIQYADGSVEELILENPTNWWSVEQDLSSTGIQAPYRMNLRTGKYYRPGAGVQKTDGGSATLLEMPLDPTKKLKSLELECLSNGIVIGIIEAYLEL